MIPTLTKEQFEKLISTIPEELRLREIEKAVEITRQIRAIHPVLAEAADKVVATAPVVVATLMGAIILHEGEFRLALITNGKMEYQAMLLGLLPGSFGNHLKEQFGHVYGTEVSIAEYVNQNNWLESEEAVRLAALDVTPYGDEPKEEKESEEIDDHELISDLKM